MKSLIQKKNTSFERRRKRVRSKIHGTKDRPRLSVFRSHKYLYAQVIDDDAGKTLVSASSLGLAKVKSSERAKTIGEEIAKKAKAVKITKVVFDRNGYIYAGKIKAVADAAREGGLKF